MMAPETVVTVESNKPAPPPGQQQGALDWIKLNVDYFKTVPGLLKVVQLILGILCMALPSPSQSGGSAFFVFVVVTSFITTIMWSFVYLLSVREALKLPINWSKSELISYTLQTVLYFIAFIVQFAIAGYTYRYGANIAAAVFGLFNTLAYAASTFLLYQDGKSAVGASA